MLSLVLIICWKYTQGHLSVIQFIIHAKKYLLMTLVESCSDEQDKHDLCSVIDKPLKVIFMK